MLCVRDLHYVSRLSRAATNVRLGRRLLVPLGALCAVLFGLSLVSCVPVGTGGGAAGPEGTSDLRVTAETDTPEVFEGQTVTLTAVASDGTPGYLYRWDQNAGPEALALGEVTAATLTTGPLTVAGRYVFRVIATDAAGFHATGFVAVEVLRAVEASAPKLVVVGEPVELTATIQMTTSGVGLQWEVVRGEALIEDEAAATTTLTATIGETIEVVLTVTLPSSGEEPITTTRSFEIVSVPDLHPQVLIETNLGEFTLELDGEAAPLHAANFLAYVDDGFFDGLLFHRVVCVEDDETDECEPFVAQGGGYQRVDGELELKEPTREAVASEADNGLSNGVLYSVSLAQTGDDPDSGTTQFFINLDEDNVSLDDGGFTVFASVVDGIDVVDMIAWVETVDNPVIGFGETSLPVDDVIMERVNRVVEE